MSALALFRRVCGSVAVLFFFFFLLIPRRSLLPLQLIRSLFRALLPLLLLLNLILVFGFLFLKLMMLQQLFTSLGIKTIIICLSSIMPLSVVMLFNIPMAIHLAIDTVAFSPCRYAPLTQPLLVPLALVMLPTARLTALASLPLLPVALSLIVPELLI